MRQAIVVTATVLLTTGCAYRMIEGTRIRDTSENREVLAVLVQLQEAMRARDADAILALVSPTYFENNGTPDRRDDYGFEELRTTILAQSLAVVEEVFVAFEIFEIVVDGATAYADVRYASRTKLDLPSGTLWDSHREFNRVALAREQDVWRITSGL